MTPSQLVTLKAAIDANPTWAAFPANDDGHFALAAALNAPANPAFTVWRTDAPVAAINDAINWSQYTPGDTLTDAALAAPGATPTQLEIASADAKVHRIKVRLLAVQTKQMNLQLMLQGRETVNAARPNVRGGLRDAVIQLPTGPAGAFVSPGGASGATVLAVCTRNATEGEKILATASQASDTTGSTTARVMGFEGNVSGSDVQQARAL